MPIKKLAYYKTHVPISPRNPTGHYLIRYEGFPHDIIALAFNERQATKLVNLLNKDSGCLKEDSTTGLAATSPT